jgi:hypothetical protein
MSWMAHPLGPDALPELHQRAGLQDLLLLQGLEPAEQEQQLHFSCSDP